MAEPPAQGKKAPSVVFLLALAFSLANTRPALAQPDLTPEQSALMDLARQFVNTVGQGLEKADALLAGNSRIEIAEKLSGTEIPDGEMLILQGLVGESKLPLNNDITAVKENGMLMLSLSELFSAADIAIAVDADGTASGWFIREDQDFYLDANTGEVRIMGQALKADTTRLSVRDGDIMAASDLIEKWFGMEFGFNFADLSLSLKTSQPLPVEERYARRKRQISNSLSIGKPELPLLEIPVTTFSPPSIDTNIRTSYRRSTAAGGTGQVSASWSSIAAGDVAGLEAKGYAGGNDQNTLADLRLSFEKKSDNADLLGPLHARRIEGGDITGPIMPLIGPAPQEQGLRISNAAGGIATSQDLTDIRGDAQPGWDIELYRGDRLLDFQTVSDSGEYNFPGVHLQTGDNDLRLIFYGPQGEIKEERRDITVDPSRLARGRGTYDIALTRSNIVTFRADELADPDDGKPHLAAFYEYGLGSFGSLGAGLRRRSEDGQDKTYIQAGLASRLDDLFLNTTLGYDLDGEYGAEALARQRFGRHSARLKYRYNTDHYSPDKPAATPATHTAEASLSGPLFHNFMALRRINYDIDTDYRLPGGGGNEINARAGLSGHTRRLTLNTTLDYHRETDTLGVSDDTLSLGLNSRGFWGKGRWRLSSGYALRPQSQLSSVTGQYTYPFTNKLEGVAELERNIPTSSTETTLSMNWQTDHATFSPRLSNNTGTKNLEASLNVRFGLAHDPWSGRYEMVNQRLSGNGGVSARVFLDANGNGLHDTGETFLKDVEVEAVQDRRSAITDDEGIAFLASLPPGQLTDIRIDVGTLPDPYYLPYWPGVSVRPRPGSIAQLEFPIVTAGEVDGTLSLKTEDGSLRPARQYTLNLISTEGIKVMGGTAAYDGFYILSNVPPGVYYLMLDETNSERTGYDLPAPVKIEIAPDGTALLGTNLSLIRKTAVPYRFASNRTGLPSLADKSVPMYRNIRGEDYFVSLGRYHSRLALSLAWYRFRFSGLESQMADLLALATPLSKIEPDPKTGLLDLKLRLLEPKNFEAMDALCQDLNTQGYNCSIEIFTHYDHDVAEGQTDKSES